MLYYKHNKEDNVSDIIDLEKVLREKKQKENEELAMMIIDTGCYLTGRSIDDVKSFTDEDMVEILEAAFTTVLVDDPEVLEQVMTYVEELKKEIEKKT